MYKAIYFSTLLSVAVVIGLFGAAYVFKSHKEILIHIGKTWIMINFIIFLSPSPILFFVAAGLVLYIRIPENKDERIFYFTLIFMAAPSSFNWLPYVAGKPIVKLDYLMVAVLVILMPLLTQKYKENRPKSINEILFGFVLFMMICLDFRESTFTVSLRSILTNLCVMGGSFYAFSKMNLTIKTLEQFFLAIAIAAFPLGLIAVYQALNGWEVYSLVENKLSTYEVAIGRSFSRGSFVRTTATMTPIPFGMFMAIAAMFLIHYRHQFTSKLLLLGIIGIAFFSIYTSGARAAVLLFIIGIFVAVYYAPQFKKIKPLVTFSMVLVFFTYILSGDALDELIAADSHGTFDYRLRLFETSMLVLEQNPFFGERYYIHNPTLEVMRQGQGIIDMVNIYLQIVLPYGMVTLTPVIILIFISFFQLNKIRVYYSDRGDIHAERLLRYLFSAFAAYFIVIATISFVDRIEYFMWMFLGIVAGLNSTLKQELSPFNKNKNDNASESEDSSVAKEVSPESEPSNNS